VLWAARAAGSVLSSAVEAGSRLGGGSVRSYFGTILLMRRHLG
jgi:hypothetical protein